MIARHTTLLASHMFALLPALALTNYLSPIFHPFLYNSLCVSSVELSSDIVRSKSFDSTSFLLNQSLTTRLLDAPTAYSVIDRHAYCAPGDRIGRSYA